MSSVDEKLLILRTTTTPTHRAEVREVFCTGFREDTLPIVRERDEGEEVLDSEPHSGHNDLLPRGRKVKHVSGVWSVRRGKEDG